MTTSSGEIAIQLLADHPYLIPAVGAMRWREWGRASDLEDRERWIAVTARESGRYYLPVTWVAIDSNGEAVGAVGIGPFDLEERRDRSPWVWGMIVRHDCRSVGVGRLLLTRLEAWARLQGYEQVWVATGGPAVAFYRRCGWEMSEVVEKVSGGTAVILMKQPRLDRP
jgi:GNAT superfamily N-acetyltransferase